MTIQFQQYTPSGPRAYTPPSTLLHDAASIVGPTSNFRNYRVPLFTKMEMAFIQVGDISLPLLPLNTTIQSNNSLPFFALFVSISRDFQHAKELLLSRLSP